MRLLLGSGGIRTPDRLAVWTDQVRSFLGPGVRRQRAALIPQEGPP